jgi:dihydrofolate reductase
MIRGMMAVTLDGHVAEADGDVQFLDAFADVDWGFEAFLARIGTVVMGRRTYEHIQTLAPEWPYPGKRAYVLGQGLQAPLDGDAEVWGSGLPALIPHLRSLTDGDVWIVGGPALQADLIREGALDQLELCVLPRLIGTGLRLFPDGPPPPRQPRLEGARILPMGLVLLDYRFDEAG